MPVDLSRNRNTVLDKVLGGVSDIATGKAQQQARREEEKRIQCEASGGTWDSINKVCIREKKKETEKGKEREPISEEQRDAIAQANPGKVVDKYGDIKTPEQIEAAKLEIQRTEATKGGTQLSAAQALEQRQQQAILDQAIGKIGQVGGLTPAQEAEINFSQALTAGAANFIPGVLGGAIGGAVAGGASSAGSLAIPGAIGGAIIGGIGTFITGTLNNIKTQQRGELRAAKEELTAARTNMRQLAMLASRDPSNADYYISLYNDQITRVYQARRQTQAETSGDLNSWIEDGRTELAEFDVFLRPGGIADIYGQKLQVALQTQTPLSITGDQLFLEETE